MKSKSLKEKIGLVAIGVMALAVMAGSYFRALDSYELQTLDLRFRLRPPIPTSDKIVIVEIGDDTIQKLGRFPFDRSYFALLIKALSEAGADSVLLDVFFSEPQASDKEFIDAISASGQIYLPIVFELDRKTTDGIPSAVSYAAQCLEDISANAKGIGHINVIPDIDGKFRRVPAYIRYEGYLLQPYLSLLAACDHLGISQKGIKFVPGSYLDLGRGIRVPLDERSNIIVNYSAAWGKSYRHYSFVDIIQSHLAKVTGEEPSMDLSRLKGKICIVGLTALGTVDLHPTSFDPLYPAVGMHAEVINSIMNKRFIQRASREANLLLLVVLAGLMAAVVSIAKPLNALAYLAGVIVILILSGMVLFNYCGIWIDLTYPVMVLFLLHVSVTLYKYVSEWKKRLIMENELQIAKKIQESFLPKSMPSVEGMSVSAAMITAREVGGDLYDFVSFPDEKIGVMIGDVSGKGVPASLFMAMSVGSFRTFALPGAAPEHVLTHLNTKLSNESSSNLFVTMFYAIFDMKKKSFIYSNGGHLPVLYFNRSGKSKFLDVEEGAPLGIIEGPYSGGRIEFGSGDTFVFYTDGVTEAMNAKSEMYGKERLVLAAEKSVSLSSEGMLIELEKDVRKFEPKSYQHDDITIMVVKIA